MPASPPSKRRRESADFPGSPAATKNFVVGDDARRSGSSDERPVSEARSQSIPAAGLSDEARKLGGQPTVEESASPADPPADETPRENDEAMETREKEELLEFSLVPEHGRITWDGGIPLDRWLDFAAPSKISDMSVAWIQVRNNEPSSPGYPKTRTNSRGIDALTLQQEALDKLSGISRSAAARGGKVRTEDKNECIRRILSIAKDVGDTVGKWMLFCDPDGADETWKRIARATVDGELGCSAKISPSSRADAQVLCCVYVDDFSNRSEVKRVLVNLKEMGFVVKAGFKPDVFTVLGIYGNNEWHLDTTIYKVKDVLEW